MTSKTAVFIHVAKTLLDSVTTFMYL